MKTNDGCFVVDPHVMHGGGRLFPYKVRDGESIKSIADRLGMTWQELSILNWGTSVPEEINWYLKHFVGCRRNDAGYYYFEDSNDPGILYLPHPLPEGGENAVVATLRVSRYPIS